MDKKYIDKLIDEAIEQAEKDGIKGKDVTPYLLAKIVEESDGASLKANIALVYNNAKLGAKIACCYWNK